MMWVGAPIPILTLIISLFCLALCIVLILLISNRNIASRFNGYPGVQYDLYEENMLLKKQIQELRMDLTVLRSNVNKPNLYTTGNNYNNQREDELE